MKRLIINADDYGLCDSVNRGILECLRSGAVSDLSFMVNLTEFREAVHLLKCDRIDKIGFHLNFTVGESILGIQSNLTDKNGRYLSLKNLAYKIFSGKISYNNIYEEIKAQINLLVDHGFKITHIDSHQNIHLLTAIMEPLMRINSELDLKVHIRMPYEKMHNIFKLKFSNLARIAILNLMTLYCSCRTNYRYCIETIGGNIFNNPHPDAVFKKVIKIIDNGPHSTYEMPVHVGYPSEKLQGYDWYSNQRRVELEFFERNILTNVNMIKIVSFNKIFLETTNILG